MVFTGLAAQGGVLYEAPRHTTLRQAMRNLGLAAVLASGLLAGAGVAARTPETSEAAVVVLATLPQQARETYDLVHRGGPFPYRKDGTAFFNRERLLPARARGYYREYTVKTPGSADRGARRIVCGGERPTEPAACYYTADHYASFARIVK